MLSPFKLVKNPIIRKAGHNALVLFCAFAALVLVGMIGYMWIEKYSPIEAVYMTIITLTTVGFSEVQPLSPAGRIFTIIIILSGVGLLAYNATFITQVLMDGKLMELYRRHNVTRAVESCSDHYIVCGYGQMGQIVVEDLIHHGLQIVVLDTSDDSAIKLKEADVLYLQADAMEEQNLLDAGILRAKGLISVVNRDADNVFIVLTARSLNDKMAIYSRAMSPGVESKLIKAGADRVVSPYASGAFKISQNILRPTVTDFIDLALSAEGVELGMEELVIRDTASFTGKKLMHSGIRDDFNLIIIAIKRGDGKMIYNPSPHEILELGDTLVAIGPRENLDRFFVHIYGRERFANGTAIKFGIPKHG